MIDKKIDPDKFLRHDDDVHRAMFEFYKEHPDLAVIDLLKQDLAPFQRKVIKGSLSHSFVLNILARGSGKTRMEAYIALIEAMFNPNKRIGFFAPGFRSAKNAFSEMQTIISESEIAQACVKKISQQTDVWQAEFHNGARVFALPLNADSKMSIRGTRVHTALIDEYPHVPKSVIDAIITPMLATQRNPMANVRRIEQQKKLVEKGIIKEENVEKSEKNRVVGLSSAYFKYNHMWETICKYRELASREKALTGKTDYAVYTFNYKDAPEGFFDTEMIAHAKATTADIIFRMEYESEFPSDSDGFFKRSLLDSCLSFDSGSFDLEMVGEKGFRYFMGIDPARNNDNFSICILKLVEGEMRLVRVVSYNQTALPIVAKRIRALLRAFDVFMIGIDAGGGGLAMKDLLADPMTADGLDDIILDMEDDSTIGKQGRRIIKMVDFVSGWISEANFDLKGSLEHKRLMFPNISAGDTFLKPESDADDPKDEATAEFLKTMEEMQTIVVTMTKTGVMHFDTENQRMRKDRYSALLIAHSILYNFIKQGFQVKELATGAFLGKTGLLYDLETEEAWQETKIIDQIRAAARKHNQKFDGANL